MIRQYQPSPISINVAENVSNESSHEGVKILEATAEFSIKHKEFASGSPCQPHEEDIFNPDNIIRCQKYVRCIQRKLDAAVAAGDKPKIRWYQHLLSKRSRAAKVLAVWRVTKKNRGRHTAGMDQVAIPKASYEQQNQARYRILSEININTKPIPIRRVFIPKSNGKKRPLGIPSLADRVNQEIIRQAIEPICEFYFHDSSYGFRPKRSCQDAMSDLFVKLSQKGCRQWIVDADISGCFDHISHHHIEQTLQKWHVQGNLVTVIHKMLKAKIFDNGQIVDNESGTPQGSIFTTAGKRCLDSP